MATPFHADLLSASFPYNFNELGSTIVVGSSTESPMQTPASLQGNDAEKQKGYCQGYFLENVMPIARGYASVGFSKLSGGPLSEPMDHMLEVRTKDNELIQVGVKDTRVWVALGEDDWRATSAYAEPSVTPEVAVVRGVSYLWFGTYSIYKFDPILQTLVVMPTPALGTVTIKGVCSGGSQLVVHDNETVYYSAVLDAADFTPSLATGAGSTKVLSLRGNILTCIPLGGDFVIYTQYNAVFARSTGNLTFPFTYQEINGSIGISKTEHVASNTNTGVHVVYTTAGFQQISPKGAEFIWPELGEGINRGIAITLDPITFLPKFTAKEGLAVRMSFVAGRWICVSVGDNPNLFKFTDLYIFDVSLARWGRLKVTHSCVFQWGIELLQHTSTTSTYQDLQTAYPVYSNLDAHVPSLTYYDITDTTITNAALSKNSPAVFSNSGSVSGIVLSGVIPFGDTSNNGGTDASTPKLILGKYKVVRNHGIIFQHLRCNKILSGTITLHGHDYNGDIIRSRSSLKQSPRHKDTWYTSFNADAISVEFNGVFILTDLTILCVDAGSMNSYATPLKKFDRLLLSDIYPMEAYELSVIEGSGAIVYLSLITSIIKESDIVAPSYSLVSGSLIGNIQYVIRSASDLDTLTTAYSLQSGSLISTVQYVTASATESSAVISTSYTMQSGSLVVSIQYITISQTELDTISTSYSLTSGSLV